MSTSISEESGDPFVLFDDANFVGMPEDEVSADSKVALPRLNTSLTSASVMGSLVWSETPREDAGTKIEFTNTSIKAGRTGWRGVTEAQICLQKVHTKTRRWSSSQEMFLSYRYIQSLMGTLCFEKALLFRSWWMQCIERKPCTLADRLSVTGTLTA